MHVSEADYTVLLLFIAPVSFDFPFCCSFRFLKLVLISDPDPTSYTSAYL